MASGSQRSIARVTEIGRVATRHGFGYLVERRRAPDANGDGDRGRRLREMLDELGPTFVKFGQLLSTRPDVVPLDIIVELQKLQDDVTPFPIEDVERVVREDLGLGIEQAFLSFDERPIAAASIGQVHRATLPNEEDVVVKVQRPSAPRQIESDLKLMASVARLVRERVRQLDFLDTGELVDEFARSIRQERTRTDRTTAPRGSRPTSRSPIENRAFPPCATAARRRPSTKAAPSDRRLVPSALRRSTTDDRREATSPSRRDPADPRAPHSRPAR